MQPRYSPIVGVLSYLYPSLNKRTVGSVMKTSGTRRSGRSHSLKISEWPEREPTMTTGTNHPMAELRNQNIQPFTNLLLHDMGAGLADNMGEGQALGSEWRTAPLWNIGLTAGVSGGESYLHDGRAGTLEEAILWHGGEGAPAKEQFRTMPATKRNQLIKYLKSL